MFHFHIFRTVSQLGNALKIINCQVILPVKEQIVLLRSINILLYVFLRPWHPVAWIGVPSGQVSHLSPLIPGLQMHFPDICSQSLRTDPYGEQSHARTQHNINLAYIPDDTYIFIQISQILIIFWFTFTKVIFLYFKCHYLAW